MSTRNNVSVVCFQNTVIMVGESQRRVGGVRAEWGGEVPAQAQAAHTGGPGEAAGAQVGGEPAS